MTAGTCIAEFLRGLDHRFLVLGLSRPVRVHASVTNLPDELRPVRVLRGSRYTVGAGASRHQQQVGRFGERQRGVLDRLPASIGARERIGGHCRQANGDLSV